jgi:hypothetical protein
MSLIQDIKNLIMEFVPLDFEREYRHGMIRLIGKINKPDKFKVVCIRHFHDKYIFPEIMIEMQLFGVDLQTIHGAQFASKQMCNQSIKARGGKSERKVDGIFERMFGVPNREKCRMFCYRVRAAVIGHGLTLDDLTLPGANMPLLERYMVFGDIYGNLDQ